MYPKIPTILVIICGPKSETVFCSFQRKILNILWNIIFINKILNKRLQKSYIISLYPTKIFNTFKFNRPFDVLKQQTTGILMCTNIFHALQVYFLWHRQTLMSSL